MVGKEDFEAGMYGNTLAKIMSCLSATQGKGYSKLLEDTGLRGADLDKGLQKLEELGRVKSKRLREGLGDNVFYMKCSNSKTDLTTNVGAGDDGRGNIKAELEHFYDGFIRYKELVMLKQKVGLSVEQENELQTLRVQLQRKYGTLKKVIEKYGGPSVLLLEGGKHEYEAFTSAFNYTMFSRGALTAVMNTAITTLNMATGNLEEPLDSEQLSWEDNTMPKSLESWKAIENEFGISKKTFGRNINFVSDSFKRSIIFRDVEHSFVLASSGFSKPAVILAGGVIEELLRLYLEHHKISPISDNFDGYIKTCEQNRLLKSGISRLSDSVRHFRNLVHLSKESTKKHTISKATAKGAVSSIFTIANDF